MLQFLEHVLLALAVAGDVGNRPHRISGFPLGLAERTHPHPEPAAVRALVAGDADLLLLPLAFARRFQEPKHRFRNVRVADEDPLDGANVLRAHGTGQRQIGFVEIDHVAARVGDREPVEGAVGDAADHGIVGAAVGEADDAGGEREQAEQPDHRQQRQKPQDIGLRLRRGRWSSARPPPRPGRPRPGAPARCCRAAAVRAGSPSAGTDRCQCRRSWREPGLSA